ncbi:MAG: hypothetical protein ACRC1I_09595, partial [Pseudomonas proteolytica]
PKPGNTEPGYVDFAIPREAVIHGAGKTVLIQYTVTSPCKLASSRTLPLQISVPVRLPTPVVPQATNNILDLGTFAGDADVRVEAWWFILPGQRVWLRCVGTNIDGSAYTINIAVAQEVTQGDVSSGLNEVLKRLDLEKLKHDTPLVLTCKVTADGSIKENEAVEFAPRELIIRRPVVVIEERFEAQATRTYRVGGVVDTPTMTVTFISGPSLAGIVPYGNDQYYSGQCYVMCQNVSHAVPPQIHRFDFKHKLEAVKFGWSWKQNPGSVTFYDEQNHVLAVCNYPDEKRGGFWVDYSPENGQLISRMEVTVEDYSFIDNFTMAYRA